MSDIQLAAPRLPASAFERALLAFNSALALEPTAEEIKKHPFLKQERTVVKDGKTTVEKVPLEYLPIEYVENKLDHFFLGLWQTYNFKYQVIVNELVGDLELAVYNKEAGIWLRRVGTGAVIIQQQAQYEVIDGKRVKKENDFLDINRKIANTLGKDMGHLKAECIKNAAKSLGRTFGRDLSRNIDDTTYTGDFVIETTVEDEIKDVTTLAELRLYLDTLPMASRNDKRIRNVLKDKQLEIKKAIREAQQAEEEQKKKDENP